MPWASGNLTVSWPFSWGEGCWGDVRIKVSHRVGGGASWEGVCPTVGDGGDDVLKRLG